jgi:hypothetical protein
MVTPVTEGRTQKLPQKYKRLSEYTDMTIHWKALSDGTIFISHSKVLLAMASEGSS